MTKMTNDLLAQTWTWRRSKPEQQFCWWFLISSEIQLAFDQQFSNLALASSMAVGAADGVYQTKMFKWGGMRILYSIG